MKNLILALLLFVPTAVHSATQLNVPFTTQAPDTVWVQPWQDACEEASVFMVHRYYTGKTILNAADAKHGILEIFDMKHQLHGQSLDETAHMIADIINAYLPWHAKVIDNPSIASIEQELDAGRPVIVPFAAPELRNPHFRSNFPYHMGVISGYDADKQIFLVEEPGTRYGASFHYTYETVMEAMHDFLPGNVSAGAKRAIFTAPGLGEYGSLDADNDGLTLAEEFQYGTVPYLRDSDGDGFLDGIEVQFGYFPTKNEQSLIKNGTLLIAPTSPKVFMIENGTKRHVTSEAVFTSRGWSWDRLEWVSDAMLDSIPTGVPLN